MTYFIFFLMTINASSLAPYLLAQLLLCAGRIDNFWIHLFLLDASAELFQAGSCISGLYISVFCVLSLLLVIMS